MTIQLEHNQKEIILKNISGAINGRISEIMRISRARINHYYCTDNRWDLVSEIKDISKCAIEIQK